MRKAELRRTVRARRIALSLEERRRAARSAARHLLRSPALRDARHVAIYLAAGSELDPAPLVRGLRQRGIALQVPVVDRQRHGRMRFVALPARGGLRRNRHGIPEPVGRCVYARFDAVVLPLVGFDAEGHRLGSGAGYYDRWLAKLPGRRPLLIGYAFALQETESVPAEPWDVRLDAICTENGFRYLRASRNRR